MYQLESELENLEIDNNQIISFLKFLPISTFDDFPMVYRYYNNALHHYRNAEYELSIFSFYLLYMHILHCLILKKRLFQLDEIQKDFKKFNQKIPSIINPFHYSILHDKGKFVLFERKDLEETHFEIADMRNDIHNIGIIKESREMELFLTKMLFILNSLYPPILQDLVLKMNLESELKQEDTNIPEDFLLSINELSELKKIIDF